MVSVTSWDELRVILRDLETAETRPFWTSPASRAEKMAPPFRIMLRPWAIEVAQELHARFGNDVLLTVGFLPYPAPRPTDPLGADRSAPKASEDPPLDADVAETIPVQPLVARSGHDISSELLLINRGTVPLVIENPGAQRGRVLDPGSGQVVGASAEAHAWAGVAPWVRAVPAHMRPALARLTAPPDGAVTVPILVGTASYRRSLGYAVPPGEWVTEVVLDLGSEGRRRALLPLHVTA
jgi:hypothetical protein